jgi:hypothetical protein
MYNLGTNQVWHEAPDKSPISDRKIEMSNNRRKGEREMQHRKRLTLEVRHELSVESAYFSPLRLSCHQLELATT